MKNTILKKYIASAVSISAALVLFAGCGSSKYSTDADYGYSNGAEMAAFATEEAAYDYAADESVYLESKAEAPAEAGGTSQAETVTEQASSRKLITTVNLSAETKNFDESVANIEEKATSLGGYIESENVYTGGYYRTQNSRDASFTIRIPAAKLNDFVTDIKENSNVTNYSQGVEDVTLSYVDLESHIKALKEEQEALGRLMEKAETVEDLITIENRNTQVRYELESYESQRRTYDNKINFSTVYLNLSEVVELTPVEEQTVWQRISTGFVDNLKDLGEFLVDLFVELIISLPVLVFLAIIVLVIVLIVRYNIKKAPARREKRAAKKAAKEAAKEASKETSEETK